MSDVATRVAAVIVDFHSGETLTACVESLRSNGVEALAVVNNGTPGSTAIDHQPGVIVIEPRVNLGYGRGVNRGAAALRNHELLLVSNPDVVVHDDAVAHLVRYLDEHPAVGLVGPQILTTSGEIYPLGARFSEPRFSRLARRHCSVVAVEPVVGSLSFAGPQWSGGLGLGRLFPRAAGDLRSGRRI